MKVIDAFTFDLFTKKMTIACLIFDDITIPGNKSFIQRVFNVWRNSKGVDCRIMAWKEYKTLQNLKSDEWVFLINFYINGEEILSILNPSTTIIDVLFKTLQIYKFSTAFKKELIKLLVELIPTLYKTENHFQIPEKDYMKKFYSLILRKIQNKENPPMVFKFRFSKYNLKNRHKNLNDIKDPHAKNIRNSLYKYSFDNNRKCLTKDEVFKNTCKPQYSMIKDILVPYYPVFLNLSNTKMNNNQTQFQIFLQKSQNIESLDAYKQKIKTTSFDKLVENQNQMKNKKTL